MYRDLFDRVQETVKAYGEGCFDDNRFWNVLTDKYPFQQNLILKSIFKDILASGYLTEIRVPIQSKIELIDIIRRYNEIFLKKYPGKEIEIATVLFSLARALKKCTLWDYKGFIKRKSGTKSTSKRGNKRQQKTTPQNNNTKSNHSKKLNKLDRGKLLYIIIGGLIVTIGATWAFSLIFSGWSIGLIIFVIALVQTVYFSSVYLLYRFVSEYRLQKLYVKTIFPIGIAAAFTALLCVPMSSPGCQEALAIHLDKPNFQPDADSAGVGLLVSIAYWSVFYFAAEAYWKMRKKLLFGSRNTKEERNLTIIITLSLVAGYIILFLSPAIKNIYEFNSTKAQLRENLKIALERENEKITNSFMGFSLGGSYKNYFDSIKNTEPVLFYEDNILDITPDESIWSLINKIDGIRLNSDDENNDKDKIILKGEDFRYFSELNLQNTNVTVYGYENKVEMIKISFSEAGLDKSEMTEITKLFIEKYGQPEKYNGLSIEAYADPEFKLTMPSNFAGYNEEINVWTFYNCTIFQTAKEILYVDKVLLDGLYNLKNRIIKKRQERISLQQEESRRIREEFLRQQKEKRDNDSLLKIESKKRAFENI